MVKTRQRGLVVGYPGYLGIVKSAVGAADLIHEGEFLPDFVMSEYSVVQFCGGEDVYPGLYGEPADRRTSYSIQRDLYEISIFRQALSLGIPMVGICRGSQFLNVMCGGSMYQHVNGHGIQGVHEAVDIEDGFRFDVTSTHHQISKLGPRGVPLAICDDGRTQERIVELEAFKYPDYKVFGVQFHPEYMDPDTDAYQWYVKHVQQLIQEAA